MDGSAFLSQRPWFVGPITRESSWINISLKSMQIGGQEVRWARVSSALSHLLNAPFGLATHLHFLSLQPIGRRSAMYLFRKARKLLLLELVRRRGSTRSQDLRHAIVISALWVSFGSLKKLELVRKYFLCARAACFLRTSRGPLVKSVLHGEHSNTGRLNFTELTKSESTRASASWCDESEGWSKRLFRQLLQAQRT
jgi:hypothetical protein